MKRDRPDMVNCQICGRIIQVKQRGAVPRYCSNACRQRASSMYREAHREDVAGDRFICEYCGKTFFWSPSKTNSALPWYCSMVCKTEASRSRNKIRYSEYQHKYHLEHYKKKTDANIKLTPEERKTKIRAYNTEYKRKWREKKKQNTENP